jgi:prophage regulatory protein
MNNRAARLQFAIHELLDILAEDITARVVTAVSKQLAAQLAVPPARRPSLQPAEPQPRRLLRRVEVTERTGLQKNTIYDQIRRGTFPAQIKIGGSVRWLESDVNAWIERQLGDRL